jgi:phage terminase Nu1 subunit (DNA packaging protein)
LAPEAGIWHDNLHLVVGHQLGPEQRQLLDGADAAASRMFQNLGMVEIDFTSREIVREAIKFLRNAAQFPFRVLLGRFVRQSPGMIGLRVIVR